MKTAILTATIFITAEFIVYGSITTGWGSFALLCGSFFVSACIMFTHGVKKLLKDILDSDSDKYFNRN